ncbi:DUF2345 domain-containing protein [Stenotrophomonas sp. MMGLT7]|uniref:DUF2345 domain-containing protein n=1 Tax=Stenotrophomonas sp. MMGLT7 TaxID=2901227 RepID=UPI002F90D1C6
MQVHSLAGGTSRSSAGRCTRKLRLLQTRAAGRAAKRRSRQQLKVVSANAAMELAADKMVYLATVGGASVTIEGGNITFACPGNIRVHAAKKSFVGPVQQAYPLPQFPRSSCRSCILDAARQGTPGVLV